MQTKQTITIRFATEEDAERITDFRVQQFKTAKEFEILNLNSLSIQRGEIFIAEIDDKIISTMQIEIISTLNKLRELSYTQISNDFSLFDTLYLSKGATLKDFRNTGMNSYLRKLTIKKAFKNSSISSLTGIGYENAPRLKLLKDIGYTFTDIELIDKTYTKPNGRVYLLTLPKNNFPIAYDLLKKELQEFEGEYTIADNTNI